MPRRRSSAVLDSAASGANARLSQPAVGCPPEKLRARCAENRKQDRDIERRFLTKQARRYENRFRRQHDDFIDFGNNFPKGCKFFLDGHSQCASGRPPLMARTAGTLMTASPSQLLLRIKMRNGLSRVFSGKKTPRLYLESRRFWPGCFPTVVDPKPISGRA